MQRGTGQKEAQGRRAKRDRKAGHDAHNTSDTRSEVVFCQPSDGGGMPPFVSEGVYVAAGPYISFRQLRT